MFNGPINHSTCPTRIQILPKKKTPSFQGSRCLVGGTNLPGSLVCTKPPFQEPPCKNVLLSQGCMLVIFSGAAFLPCQVKPGRFSPGRARSVRVPFGSAINKFIVSFSEEKGPGLEPHCACPCEDLLCAKQRAIGWRGSFFITPLRMQLKAEDYRNSFPLVREGGGRRKRKKKLTFNKLEGYDAMWPSEPSEQSC